MTKLARVVPFGISPTLSTYLMQSVSLTLPLVIGGALQLANDIAFYLMFRDVKPPEELGKEQFKVQGSRFYDSESLFFSLTLNFER